MSLRKLIEYDDDYVYRRVTFNEKGEKICINCDAVLPKRRLLYCSDKCCMEFYRKHVKDWGMIREQIFKRDKYICQECGIKTSFEGPLEIRPECDHIIPISLGGAEFKKSNLQTLCHDCHAKKTGRDRGPYKTVYRDVHLGIQKKLM